MVLVVVAVVVRPLVQQSAPESKFPYPNSVWQLLFPQNSSPAHSLSLSQSPPPTIHGLYLEQQLQSKESSPVQEFEEFVGGVVV